MVVVVINSKGSKNKVTVVVIYFFPLESELYGKSRFLRGILIY